MKAGSSESCVVIVLETNKKSMKPLSIEDMTPIQKRIFANLNVKVQDQIKQGWAVLVTQTGREKPICTYNTENYAPSDEMIETYANLLFERIKRKVAEERKKRNANEVDQ